MRNILIFLLLGGVYLYSHEGQNIQSEKGRRQLSERPKCIVCGMYADMDTLWMTEIELTNGSKLLFESPLHGFKFYLNPEKFTMDSVKREDISVFFVRDFSTGKKIRADSAIFIVYSELKGPMGRDLVPVNKKDAEKLSKKHKGKLIKFSDITEEFIKNYESTMKMKVKGEGVK